MSRIRRLPEHLINKIAAGEVSSEGASTAPSETSPRTGLRRQSRRSNEGGP